MQKKIITNHIHNYNRPILHSNIMCKIYEKILQEAVNFLIESKFFDGKNNAYQKALIPLIEQMFRAIVRGKYGVLAMADLEGAFGAVWRNTAIYKLHKSGLRNKFLPSATGF